MVFSCAIKSLLTFWGMPPSFPSGHMLGVVAFYGWLGWWILPVLWGRFILAFGISVYGWALWYKGYHVPQDILGAFLIGLCMLVFYHYMRRKTSYNTAWMGWFLWATLCPLMGLLAMVSSVPPHVWMAFYTLLGIVTMFLTYSTLRTYRSLNRILFSVGLLGSFYLIGMLCRFSAEYLPLQIACLPWVMSGGLISFWSKLCRTRQSTTNMI